MGLILWVILIALAGWIASVIMKSDNEIFMGIILGVAGAFIGGIVMNFIGRLGVTGFNIYSILVAVVGQLY